MLNFLYSGFQKRVFNTVSLTRVAEAKQNPLLAK